MRRKAADRKRQEEPAAKGTRLALTDNDHDDHDHDDEQLFSFPQPSTNHEHTLRVPSPTKAMNRPGQPPQRPPNLGPSQGLGGPFRGPFPPSSAFGMPPRTGSGLQQQTPAGGFPGMPSAHRTPGQNMVLPSPGFLQQQQPPRTAGGAGSGGYPFGAASLAQQQQQAQAAQQQQPSHQPAQQQPPPSLAASQNPASAQQNPSAQTQPQLAQQQQQQQQQQVGMGAGAGGGPPNGQDGGGQLDPNDFPALGSNSATVNATTNSPATTFASSYASQAGTGIPPLGNVGHAHAPSQGGASIGGQTRDFTPDDFPALGGGGGSQQQQQQQHHSSTQTQNPSTVVANGPNGAGGAGGAVGDSGVNHPPGLNGFEPRQSMPPGLLNLTGAQRNMVVADAEKRATSKLSTWSGAAAAAAASAATGGANGTNASSNPQQTNGLSAITGPPPGVPSPYTQPSGTGDSLPQQQPNAPNSTNASNAVAVPQTPAQQILMSAADRWGLLGLLTSIKNADPDQNLLTIGTDLGTMGLDMQTQGSLFSTFITPWSDSSAAHTVEPDFHLPQCYNVIAPAPGSNKAQAFSEETLFYMFYAHPRDALQEVAAQELHARNWRYNKELRIWLTKETGRLRASKTIEGGAGEQGVFTYWDPDLWEKGIKEFTVMYADLETKDTVPPAFVGSTLQPNSAAAQQQQGQGQGLAGLGALGGGGVGVAGQMQGGLGRGTFPGLSMTAAAM